MNREGYDFCPVCHSKEIKVDRYYSRRCEECKAEWLVETGNTRFEIIFNPKKEFII